MCSSLFFSIRLPTCCSSTSLFLAYLRWHLWGWLWTVVPSLKSHVSSELLPSEWVAMKCQMRAQMDGWLRVRGLERQSFALLNPKELSFIGSTTTYGYFNVASPFMVSVFFTVELSCESELINTLKWLYTFYILNQCSGIWCFSGSRTAFWMLSEFNFKIKTNSCFSRLPDVMYYSRHTLTLLIISFTVLYASLHLPYPDSVYWYFNFITQPEVLLSCPCECEESVCVCEQVL